MGELYELVPRLVGVMPGAATAFRGFPAAVRDGTLTLNHVVLTSTCNQRVPGFRNLLQWCPHVKEAREDTQEIEITEEMPILQPELMVLCGLEVKCGDASSGHTYNFWQNAWHENNTPLRLYRDEPAIAATSTEIYVVGGRADGPERIILDSVERYDIGTDRWSMIAPMKIGRCQAGAICSGGALYVFGGVQPYRGVTSTVEVYRNHAWTFMADLPRARHGLQVAALGSKFFVCGGMTNKGVFDSVDIYDLQTHTWSSGPAMQQARANFGIAVFEGRIFVAGGRSVNDRLSSVECYDGHEWRLCSPMPTARSHATLTVAGSIMYAIGGFTGWHVTAKIETYDPVLDKWSNAPPLPTPRWGHGSVLLARTPVRRPA